jgi:hypothetical protein
MVTFTASVSSGTTPTYWWYRNGVLLTFGPAASYTISSATTNDAGNYTVGVTNASPGGILSSNAVLTVNVKPYISAGPASQAKLYTSNVTFTVTAGGSPQLTYQWRFNGVNLANKTGTSCTLNNLQLTNAGNYAVVVNNGYGSVTSAVATLTVNYMNLIPFQPPGWSDKIVVSTVTNTITDNTPLRTTNNLYIDFGVQNNGSTGTSAYGNGGGFTNQLFLDGVLKISPFLSGGASLSAGFYITISDYSPGMLSEGTHTLTVLVDSPPHLIESDEGDNSYSRIITIIGPPTITNQPSNQTVVQGTDVTFNVAAAGQSAQSFQWYYNGWPLTDATNAAYTVTNVQYLQAGNYSATVSNQYGTSASSNAYLTVTLLPGMVVQWGDGDGGVPQGLTGVRAIAQGFNHGLALLTNTTVVAWGFNDDGETNVPLGLSNVVQIAAGFRNSLALRADGTVFVWGYNGYGLTNVPASLTNVAAISMGTYHALALKTNGTVVAWGPNLDGECNVPAGLSNVVAIAAGDGQSLALKNDGTIVGWGYTGDGAANAPSNLSGVISLGAASGFSIALRNDGTVIGWGSSPDGQTNVPPALTNAIAVAAGGAHSLALRADGTILGWGQNTYGEADVPPGLFSMVGIASGGYTSLGLMGNGSVVITMQPVGQKAFKGGSATFTVLAAGNPAVSYQWRFNGTNIAGATQNLYTRTNAQSTNAGLYSVVVSNSFGAVTSASAPLTVTQPLVLTPTGFGVGGGFKITVTGPPFATFVIESSVGLTTWNDRATNALSGNGSFNYTDSNAPNFTKRYYRARLQ